MLELLSTAEGKLVALAEELASRDLDTVRREMEDEEVRKRGRERGGEGRVSESPFLSLTVPAHGGGRHGSQRASGNSSGGLTVSILR